MQRIIVGFAIWSAHLTPDQITEIVGMPPDTGVIRGRDRVPPRVMPRDHGWHLRERTSEGDVGDALAKMIVRVRPLLSVLKRVCDVDPDVSFRMSVATRGDPRRISTYIEATTIEFLASIRSSLDIEHFGVVPG